MKKIAPWALALTLLPAGAALADLSRREEAEIKQQLAQAVQDDAWGHVPPLFERLAQADDKDAVKLMVKVAEMAPPYAAPDVAQGLRQAAVGMQDRRALAEIAKSARRSRSPAVRRNLLMVCADRQDWDTLMDALDDDDEECAALAAWRLIDNKVAAAVEPMIQRMEKLDRSKGGIWDVYRNGLGQLLGKRLGSGAEYRSLWTVVQQEGGLDSVQPESDEAAEEAGGGTQVRLFGREIDCTRVVFVLDVSGSMEAIDPDQADPVAGYSRTRDQESEKREPRGKTRLERAKIALVELLRRLPEHYEVNIVTYSSPHDIKMWRAPVDRRERPQLHALEESARAEACTWVEGLASNGTTATDLALERAYEVKGVRCIYLLSDGFATHDGQTPVPTSEILRTIEQHGAERHITVHTMGFQGADRTMMQAVAEHTGGKYSDIR